MIGRGQCSISAAAEIARNVAPRQCIAMAPSSVLDTGFDIKKYVHTYVYVCVCVRISIVLCVCACALSAIDNNPLFGFNDPNSSK